MNYLIGALAIYAIGILVCVYLMMRERDSFFTRTTQLKIALILGLIWPWIVYEAIMDKFRKYGPSDGSDLMLAPSEKGFNSLTVHSKICNEGWNAKSSEATQQVSLSITRGSF